MMRLLRPNAAALTASVCVLLSGCGHPNALPGGVYPAAAVRFEKPPRPPKPRVRITAAARALSLSAGWQQVAAASPFGVNGAGTALLMTDGTVMVHDNEQNWYSLAPDSKGDYVNGAWTPMAPFPSGYAPQYFASAVLPDGRLIVNGGEYNFFQPADTTQGAIYDPIANTWTMVAPPSGWNQIGDAPSVVLPNGTYMLGTCCDTNEALLDESTMTWTATGAGKADPNSEEGWTLLPDGNVLTADVIGAPNTEIYNASTGTWSSAGNTPERLVRGAEIGPQNLLPNGNVFVAGANANTAYYNTSKGTWRAGPFFPIVNGQRLDEADGPLANLVNGNMLMVLSPGLYQPPAYYYLLGVGLKATVGPPNAPNDASYNVRLLMLPTGQVLETDGSDDVEIFTYGAKPNTTIAPNIGYVPAKLTHGTTYTIKGKRFNGFSQENAYGDDAQMAENYPLVRIVNTATGDVFYARTHAFSSMAVASQAPVSAQFDVPAGIELGPSTLTVIANGIPSTPVKVTIN